MMIIQPGVKVHLAAGFTDLRRGLDGLAVMVEQLLEQDPFSGHMFVFRARSCVVSSSASCCVPRRRASRLNSSARSLPWSILAPTTKPPDPVGYF